MHTDQKRSHQPVAWGLFGFGGMVAALCAPALLIAMILHGFGLPTFEFSAVASTWWGAAALFLIIFGLAFHSLHRIFFLSHDFRLKTHPFAFYALAALLSLSAAAALALCLFCP